MGLNELRHVQITEKFYLDMAPNPFLCALSCSNFGRETMKKSLEKQTAKPAVAGHFKDTRYAPFGKPFFDAVLKIMMPIELGRICGVKAVPVEKNEIEKKIRALFNTETIETFTDEFLTDYVVPVYRVPLDLLLAHKDRPNQINPVYKATSKKPSWDLVTAQVDLIRIALNIDDARKGWQSYTILNEAMISKYLKYVDSNVAELVQRFEAATENKQQIAFDKAAALCTKLKDEQDALATKFQALDRDDAKRPKMKTQLRELMENVKNATTALEVAEKALKEKNASDQGDGTKLNKAGVLSKNILSHGIFIADYGVITGGSLRNKILNKEGADAGAGGDDENEEEEAENDEEEKPAKGDAKDTAKQDQELALMNAYLESNNITAQMVEIMSTSLMHRVMSFIARIREAERKVEAKGGKAESLLAPYDIMRTISQARQKGMTKSKQNGLFPDQYTIHFQPTLKTGDKANYLTVTIGNSKTHFPLFSIRLLIENHTELTKLWESSFPPKPGANKAAKSSEGGMAFELSDDEPRSSRSKTPAKKSTAATASKPVHTAVELSDSQDVASDSEPDAKPPPPPPTPAASKTNKRKKQEDGSMGSEEKKRETLTKKTKVDVDKATPAGKKDKIEEKAPAAPKKPVAAPQQPAKNEKRKVDVAELSSDSREKTKPAPKKFKPEELAPVKRKLFPAAEQTDEEDLHLNLDDVSDLLLSRLLPFGSWDLKKMVNEQDKETFEAISEAAKNMLSHAQSNNFYPGPYISDTTSVDNLVTAHSQFALEEPINTSVLIEAANLAMNNIPMLPMTIASAIIDQQAAIETDLEQLAADKLNERGTQLEIANATARAALGVDLLLKLHQPHSKDIPILTH